MDAAGAIPPSPASLGPHRGDDLVLAATTGKLADIQEATRQLLTPVIYENWKPTGT